MDASAGRAASEYSKGKRDSEPSESGLGWDPWLLLGCAVLGSLLLIVSEFQTLFQVKADTVVLKHVQGIDHHTFALGLIGIAAMPMAFGAALGRSRPAMIALAVLGAIATAIALAVDLPDATSAGNLRVTFALAKATPQLGFYLETLGAALLVIAGGAMLLMLPSAGGARRSD